MINLFKKYKWIGVGLIGLLSTIVVDNFFDITDRINTYVVSKEVQEFSNRSHIHKVEVIDGKTKIYYYTCSAPKLNYINAIVVNGELKHLSETRNAIHFSSDYTSTCQIWDGMWFDFELKDNDKLVVVWDYDEHGSFEMTYIK